VFNELINYNEYLYAGTRQCEVNLNQGIDSEDQIELMEGEIRMSQKDGMMPNLQYGSVELEMNSRNDSNRITIILRGFIDEEEAKDDISDADEHNAIILKSAEMKLLEEEILSFQDICGIAGILEFEVRSSEVMNEKPEEGTEIVAGDQWRRHLYISEMYMESYWHRDHDVLIQEHNQLQENSIQHMRSEVDKELDELWRLIEQPPNKTNKGQK